MPRFSFQSHMVSKIVTLSYNEAFSLRLYIKSTNRNLADSPLYHQHTQYCLEFGRSAWVLLKNRNEFNYSINKYYHR